MLLTKQKSRTDLHVVRCGTCSTDELRCLGTERIYVRPIQKSLIVNTEDGGGEEAYEECIFCDRLFLINQIRQHSTSCTVSLNKICLTKSIFFITETDDPRHGPRKTCHDSPLKHDESRCISESTSSFFIDNCFPLFKHVRCLEI